MFLYKKNEKLPHVGKTVLLVFNEGGKHVFHIGEYRHDGGISHEMYTVGKEYVEDYFIGWMNLPDTARLNG